MNSLNRALSDKEFLNRALEATIRIGLVVLLAAWCFQIVQHFVVPVIWGIIIAIATYPGYRWMRVWLGGRSGIAATLYTLLVLILLVVPAVLLSGTLVESAQSLATQLRAGTWAIPPPPEGVAKWPLIGEWLASFWGLASENLGAALRMIEPQLKTVGTWLLSAAAGAGFGILQFAVAIIIAGVLLAHASGAHYAAHVIATRFAGERGAEIADLAEATVRSVARGILGVALIQTLLAGIGFLVAGVPGAGLWAMLCLLFAVVQIGISPIMVPIVIYVFSTADVVTAVLFLMWSVFVTLLDNILRPILLGRGVEVPMVVIFVGAIGGFLASGIIGLFVGSVVLVLGYKLFLAWLHEGPSSLSESEDAKSGLDGDTGPEKD
jgi:predicted PurR-regulated permease PerM